MPDKTPTTIQMWDRKHDDLLDLKRQPAQIFALDGFLEVEWDIDGEGISVPIRHILYALAAETQEAE